MTTKQKQRIEARLHSAKDALLDVWIMTMDYTPEDAIVSSMLKNMEALYRILNKVKTED